jgi:hypothetical protein
MMEAAGTPETLAYFYRTTWRNIPQDGHLQCVTVFFSCALVSLTVIPRRESVWGNGGKAFRLVTLARGLR